jgi:hypothetical protein
MRIGSSRWVLFLRLKRLHWEKAMYKDATKNQTADIAMLLRDYPVGTTADVTEYCVLFFDDGQLRGAHLSPDNPGEPDELFNVEDVLPDIRENVSEWLAHPTFTLRPHLMDWLKEAPPIESKIG